MAITSYHTVDGMIEGQSTNNTRINYLPDALGSTTATVAEDGSIERTYRYKAFGSELARSGAGTVPSFRWVGTWGYRECPNTSTSYIRLRHYSKESASWYSQDPIWPTQSSYVYATQSPVTFIDVFGLAPINYKIKAFIHARHTDSTYRPPRTQYPWRKMVINPINIGQAGWYTTDHRYADEPGTSRLIVEIGIDSMEIGKSPPWVRRWADASHYSTPIPEQNLKVKVAELHYERRTANAEGCSSFIFGAAWAKYPFWENPLARTVNITFWMLFIAKWPDHVTVQWKLSMKDFPDYEMPRWAAGNPRRFTHWPTHPKQTPEAGLLSWQHHSGTDEWRVPVDKCDC